MELHERAGIDIIIVEEITNFVVPSMSRRKTAVFFRSIITVSPVIITLFVICAHILIIIIRRRKVQRRLRIRPEFCPFSCPSHRFQHLIPLYVSYDRHFLHLQVHLYRIYPCHFFNFPNFLHQLINHSLRDLIQLRMRIKFRDFIQSMRTSKFLDGVFDDSFTASAAHPDFEFHCLQKPIL